MPSAVQGIRRVKHLGVEVKDNELRQRLQAMVSAIDCRSSDGYRAGSSDEQSVGFVRLQLQGCVDVGHRHGHFVGSTRGNRAVRKMGKEKRLETTGQDK